MKFIRIILLMLLIGNALLVFSQEAGKRLKVGDLAPNLFINEWVKGKPIHKFEKGKVYLVDISIVFCPGCLNIIPKLTDLSRKYGDQVDVFVVYTLDVPARVEKFVNNMGDKMDYRVAVDVENNKTMKEWGVKSFPSCFIVNQEGKIAYTDTDGGNMKYALESILNTGKFDVDEAKHRQVNITGHISKSSDQLRSKIEALKIRGDYKQVINLVDSALVHATNEEKYHSKTGLVTEKLLSSLILQDSVSADHCLKEIMDHTEENHWVDILGLITNSLPPSTVRIPKLNYERVLEIADRAANDAGGSYRVQRMCQKANIMFRLKKNKLEAVAVLNEAMLVARKNKIKDEIEWVESYKAKIEKRDKEYQQAKRDWEELMYLFDNQRGEEYQKRQKELSWAELQLYDAKTHQRLLNKALEFCNKYPGDDHREDAKNILMQAHMTVQLPWVDTARMTPELMGKINLRVEKVNEAYRISQVTGKKIATGPPVFRMLPRDFKAETEWRRNTDEIIIQEKARPGLTLEDKELLDWSLFTRDYGQFASAWNKIPQGDEKLEDETSTLENDYWSLFAIYYWEALSLRFEHHIDKYPDLPVIADRGLNFIGAVAGRHKTELAVKRFWKRLIDTYSNPTHPLSNQAGVQALVKVAQETLSADQVAAGKEPFELTFTALDGRSIDLKAFRGKVVLIDFWATWCQPCLQNMPHLKSMYDKYREQGFEIIGVSLDAGLMTNGELAEGNIKKVKEVIEKYQLPWPQRFTGQGMSDFVASKYGIGSLPTVWLLDKEGKIVDWNARGEKLESLIRKHLGLTK